jgi:hypothetical protein
MDNNFKYFLIGSDNTPSVPLLMPDSDQSTWFLLGCEPVEELKKPMELCFRMTPAKPRMVDFHSLPDTVFSRKIYDVLYPMNIEGLQLIPATVRGQNGIYSEDYWVAYIYKRIK